MEELAAKRVERAKNSMDVTPIDVLLAMVADIRSGKVKCNSVLIAALDHHEVGNWEFTCYRANMPSDREIVVLELAKRRCLTNWLGAECSR